MRQQAPLRRVMTLIKKKRWQRKWDIHKLAFGVMVDKTTAIYLLALVGYMFIGMFIAGDVLRDYEAQLLMVEQYMRERVWLIATILPIAYTIQSFSHPGVIFSKTEYQLSILPYSRARIWALCALEKWLKKLCLFLIIGVVISLVTPIAIWSVLMYACMFVFIDILMTIPQWVLFQKSVIFKIGIIALAILLNVLNIMMTAKLFSIGVIVLLILINLRLMQSLFNNVNWGRVTEVSDFQLWNMPIIAKASEIKMERRKLYSVLQNTDKIKSPLSYTSKAIYQRLWLIYFVRHLKPLLQTVGILFVLLTVFMFINAPVFHIGLAIAIHIFTTVMSSFFRGQFEHDLIYVLPWRLHLFKQSFLKWALYSALILFIPIANYLSLYATIWIPLQVLFYVVVFIYMLRIKIEKACILLSREPLAVHEEESLAYLFLLALILSAFYPIILWSSLIVIWLIYRNAVYSKTPL